LCEQSNFERYTQEGAFDTNQNSLFGLDVSRTLKLLLNVAGSQEAVAQRAFKDLEHLEIGVLTPPTVDRVDERAGR
jgi:hypothetical protein